MKRYDLSKIMRRAWEIKHQDEANIFGLCLQIAWEEAKMGNKGMLVKEWVIDKAQETATRYNCYIDFDRNEDGSRKVYEGGYLKVYAEEVISESEKAVQVRLATGSVLGSVKGWKLWLPKSQMA